MNEREFAVINAVIAIARIQGITPDRLVEEMSKLDETQKYNEKVLSRLGGKMLEGLANELRM